ncbi:MAG TPA: DUF4363 family protein [Clostridia bacterium]|jgi:hypothetical protein
MKRAIAAIIVLAILIAVSVLEIVYVDNRLNSLKDKTLVLYQNMEQDKLNIDTTKNIETILDIEREWEKDKKIFNFLFSHNQINELTYKIVSLKTYINQNDYNMANTAAATILKNCDMLLSYFYPKLENIL